MAEVEPVFAMFIVVAAPVVSEVVEVLFASLASPVLLVVVALLKITVPVGTLLFTKATAVRVTFLPNCQIADGAIESVGVDGAISLRGAHAHQRELRGQRI